MPQQLTLPANPGFLVGTADFNGDGKSDILYTNYLLLNTGGGQFRPIALAHPLGGTVTIADVNGDGKPDLVSGIPGDVTCDYYPDGTPYCFDYSDAYLYVYLGNGDGTFTPGYYADLGPAEQLSFTLLDANGDGKPDLNVVADFEVVSGSSIESYEQDSILLNDTRGDFNTSLPGLPQIVAVGDFNGDDKVDAVTRSGEIYLGTGKGAFEDGGPVCSLSLNAAVAGDFNHDGHLDLAFVANEFTSPGGYVVLGSGNGKFGAPMLLSKMPNGTVNAVDLNHDGYLDLIFSSPDDLVFLNQRNGNFSNSRSYAFGGLTGSASSGVVGVADFNGDGNPDLLVSPNSILGLISYGSKNGFFPGPVVTQAGQGWSVATADLNHDGVPDVAVTTGSYQTVWVFPGSGKGYLNQGTSYKTAVPYGNVVIGDVNGDGIDDLVVTRNSTNIGYSNGASLSVLLGQAGGSFNPAVSSPVLGSTLSYSRQVYLVDVNHDGRLDLIGDWGVSLGNGDGTFAPAVPFSLPYLARDIIGIAVGDFNRDGNLDILVGVSGYEYETSDFATIYTLLGNGRGGFSISHQQNLTGPSQALAAIKTADMNGDGVPDMLYLHSALDLNGIVYSEVGVELGDGAGNFGKPVIAHLSGYNYVMGGLVVGDFNRDGLPDVVIAGDDTEAAGSHALLLPGTGGGNLSSTPSLFPLMMNIPTVIDLNGDGVPDLIAPAGTGVERIINNGSRK